MSAPVRCISFTACRSRPRLQNLLDRCLPGQPVWDLCCDHGYLGLAALKGGQFSEVIFNDSLPHLIDRLGCEIPAGASARRLCCLSEDIDEPVTGTVVLAGIGGERISKILHALNKGNLQAGRLVVCPEKDPEFLVAQEFSGFEVREISKIAHKGGERWILVYERQFS